MPLNTLRLNHQASSHPNERIVFIKPLRRPSPEQADYDIADTFLRAIAAQCLPIMKNHHLSATTLEEHEWNREFIGRNFNNGEIIQLVLKSKGGSWLPFNMVQMVMMHELAHNTHMNHGRQFWQTRNTYCEDLRGLWGKGYTGEGFWGSGRTLSDMRNVMGNNVVASEELKDLPVCGGTYRSRRRKRKATGADLTWKEKRDKRIEKKFGKNGVSLGEDEDTRLRLEINNKGPVGSKPRVAQSQRGRELRAAAAVARFGTNKIEVDALKQEEDDATDEYEDVDVAEADAVDTNGKRLLDSKGLGMIKVCDQDDEDGVNIKQELEEMEKFAMIDDHHRHPQSTARPDPDHIPDEIPPSVSLDATSVDADPSTTRDTNAKLQDSLKTQKEALHDAPQDSNFAPKLPEKVTGPPASMHKDSSPKDNAAYVCCPICSMGNDRLSAICCVCGHVLDVKKDPRHWRCALGNCKDGQYLNSGDHGICQICGERRP